MITTTFFATTILFIIVIILLFTFLKSRLSVFSLVFIFLSLACVDVIIPSILWSIYGLPSRPFWFQILDESAILSGILFYLLFFIVFLFSYFLTIQKAPVKSFVLMPQVKLNQKILFFFLYFFLFMSISSLIFEIIFAGGFIEWLIAKFTLRFQSDLGKINDLPISFITHLLPWRNMLVSLLLFGFLYRSLLSNKSKNILFLICFIAFVLTLATSFRGSVLIFFLGFAFIEFIRIKYVEIEGNKNIPYKKIFFLLFLASLFFIFYGALRDSSVNDFKGVSSVNKDSEFYRVLNQGSGLEGVSSIVREYGSNIDYMYGKTYFDMLLLPVPRIIYTSKPKWYGIDDITRGMGWPKSTQSAVTMAGEAYANFSYLGIIVAIFYGFIFAFIIRFIFSHPIYIGLYPTVLIQLVLVTNWMGFTGFMNAFSKAVVVFIIFSIIKKALFR